MDAPQPVESGPVVDAAMAEDAPRAEVPETVDEEPREGVRVLQYSRSDLLI
jgi:hypothetical protein